jgi:hypothetical protein
MEEHPPLLSSGYLGAGVSSIMLVPIYQIIRCHQVILVLTINQHKQEFGLLSPVV